MDNSLTREVDVCVVGAGPAGMSSAVMCAKAGASVVMLDEQPGPGGQIYRAISRTDNQHSTILGKDYFKGIKLVEALQNSKVEYIPQATLWRIDNDKTLYWSCKGKAFHLKARRIILATGALERPFPFSGWTLPGVMTAGACQIMMKTSGLVAKDAVLIGTGPLLYVLGVQMIKAGVVPKAIVDTQQFSHYMSASRYVINALLGAKYIFKGLKLLGSLRKAGVKHYHGATGIKAFGKAEVEGITFECGGQSHKLDCSVLLSHIGVTPNTQLTRAMEMEHVWDDTQRCWHPKLDGVNNTSIDGVSIAGDGGKIGGAMSAELQGKLSAVEALYQLRYMDKKAYSKKVSKLQKLIRNELIIRPFLDVLYAPPEQAFEPEDDTVICRCENVTAKQIRDQISLGIQGMNQLKAFTRSGMGPCQGRYCGQIIPHMISAQTGIDVKDVSYYRIRYPIKPLKLGELARLTPHSKSYIRKYKHKDNCNEQDTENAY